MLKLKHKNKSNKYKKSLLSSTFKIFKNADVYIGDGMWISPCGIIKHDLICCDCDVCAKLENDFAF